MEVTTKLQPYRLEEQCDKCKEGMMERTGTSFTSGNITRYDHKCNKCGHTEEYKNNYYPRIIYKEEIAPKKTHIDKESMDSFLKDLNIIGQKIESNTETVEDYLKLEEMLDIVLTDKTIIQDLYREFDSWGHFMKEKRKQSPDMNAHSVMGRIKGSIKGITDTLKKQI